VHLLEFGGRKSEVNFLRRSHGFLIFREEILVRTNPEFTRCEKGAVISITFLSGRYRIIAFGASIAGECDGNHGAAFSARLKVGSGGTQ
jgi:hypothetical protein